MKNKCVFEMGLKEKQLENMEIPKPVLEIIEKLEGDGFKAYIVGGCVRDVLIKRTPKDWDITTDAKPEEIQKIFPDSFYENVFGTVAVKLKPEISSDIEADKRACLPAKRGLDLVEITTFRTEAKYTDKRHPDEVKFAKTIEEDLKRRDFTINAMAIKVESSKVKSYKVIDLFGGQKDLKNKIIRAVGNPNERFNEDALRMIRAARFAAELNFQTEEETAKAILKKAFLLEAIAKERIRDEFIKIINSRSPALGIEILRKLGLLKFIIPELELGCGVSQNKYHLYDIYEHSLFALKAAAEQNFGPEVRIAALLHDIAKPQTKEGEGPDATFYNHDFIGAKIAAKILNRLKFPNKEGEKIILLVKNHMFLSDPDKITEAGVRRLIVRAGKENIPDLINLRISDRLGMKIQEEGLKTRTPKARPYRLRKLEYLIEKVSQDPISAKMLKINGNDIIDILKIEPGPKIGAILDVLLAEAIENPGINNKEYLTKRVRQLNEENLEALRTKAREKIEEKKEEEDLKIKGKHWIH